MSARTQMCFGDVLAEVGYNYLRTVGTPDGTYFLNMFRTLFDGNYRDFSEAYPDLASVFTSDDVNTTVGLSRVLYTILLWKMGYLRGVVDSEGYYTTPGDGGYYTGRVLPGTSPRIRQPPEAPTTEAEGQRRAAAKIIRDQKRRANLLTFVQGFPAHDDTGFAAWFGSLSSIVSWQPTFRILNPATAEAQLSSSMSACEAMDARVRAVYLPDALDSGVYESEPYVAPVGVPGVSPVDVPGVAPVVIPGVAPVMLTPTAAGGSSNVGLLVAGAAFGWLVTRFFL